MWADAWAWTREYEVWLAWAAAISLIVAIASLLLVPYVVVRIPDDYFAGERRRESRLHRLHPVLYVLVIAVKNLLGLVLLAAGIAMLVLPGQGLLTMVIGLMLLDFPGKYRLERWFMSRPSVLAGVNWVRRRAGCPELVVPDPDPPEEREA
jgi:hypothetical protein